MAVDSQTGASRYQSFERNTGESDQPDRSQQRPSQGSTQGDHRERGVGAGDQEVDGDMVQRPKSPERSLRDWKAVVESAGAVEKDQGGAIDGKGRQLRWAASQTEQQNRARSCEQQTNEMGGAVEWLADPHAGIYHAFPLSHLPPSVPR